MENGAKIKRYLLGNPWNLKTCNLQKNPKRVKNMTNT